MIIKRETPYEFLVRIDGTKIVGAHVKYKEQIVDVVGAVETILSEKEGLAKEVAIGVADKGFPLAKVLADIHLIAIQDAVEVRKQLASEVEARQAKEEALTHALSTKADSEVALAAAQAELTRTRDALEKIVNPPPPPEPSLIILSGA